MLGIHVCLRCCDGRSFSYAPSLCNAQRTYEVIMKVGRSCCMVTWSHYNQSTLLLLLNPCTNLMLLLILHNYTPYNHTE